jgi:hypothetical protein
MTTPCVCGHQPADHHAHTGHCHDCTCTLDGNKDQA